MLSGRCDFGKKLFKLKTRQSYFKFINYFAHQEGYLHGRPDFLKKEVENAVNSKSIILKSQFNKVLLFNT